MPETFILKPRFFKTHVAPLAYARNANTIATGQSSTGPTLSNFQDSFRKDNGSIL